MRPDLTMAEMLDTIRWIIKEDGGLFEKGSDREQRFIDLWSRRLILPTDRSSDPEPAPDAATIHREFESLADSFDVMAGQTGQRAWADAATAMRDKWRSLWADPTLQATGEPPDSIEPPSDSEGALLGQRSGAADGEPSPLERARGTMTARRPVGSAPTAPESLEPTCPICGKPDLFIGRDGRPGCPHCEVAVDVRAGATGEGEAP